MNPEPVDCEPRAGPANQASQSGPAPPGAAGGAGVDPTAHTSTPSRATCGTSSGPVATTT
jgi:hypothetical protein